jgi:hypothetical protein
LAPGKEHVNAVARATVEPSTISALEQDSIVADATGKNFAAIVG